MIDKVHQRPIGTARANLTRNRKRFTEGQDIFTLSADVIRSQRETGVFAAHTRNAVVLTESGYLMIAKVFNDDLSWQVQRDLVNTYFRHRELVAQIAAGEILPPPQSSALAYPSRDALLDDQEALVNFAASAVKRVLFLVASVSI